MKKTRFALTVLASAILALTTMACHDDIYYLIHQEVPQQKGLQGDINSIVPFKGNLYTANSYLYKKPLVSSTDSKEFNGQWKKVDTKCDGKKLVHINQLAADDTYLYCYTIQIKQDKNESTNVGYYKCLFASSDGETWTQVDLSPITEKKDDDHGSFSVRNITIFDNQEGNGSLSSSSGRNAYIKLASNQDKEPSFGIYKLSGTAVGTQVDPGFDVGSATTPKAVNIGGTDKFFHSNGVAKNDKYTYIGVGSTVYYTEDGNIYEGSKIKEDVVESVKLKCGNISSMSITNDYLLVGTFNGLYRVALGSDGKPSDGTTDFDNNAQTLVTAHVTSIYALDSSKNEGETDEYASLSIGGILSSSTDSFDETGLYAYYPERGNWNRDGDKIK